MKRTLLTSTIALALSLPVFADEATKKEAADAVKKLGEASSYAFTTTTAMPDGAGGGGGGGGGGGRGRGGFGGPVEGKADKEGYVLTTRTFGQDGENKTHTLRKGDKSVSTNREGVWQTQEEREAARGDGGGGGGGGGAGGGGRGRGGFGGGRGFGMMKAPAEQLTDLVSHAKDLNKDGDAVAGELTEAGAKALLPGGPGGENAPAPKASVKLWLKDGAVAKYEVKTTRSFTNRDGESREMTFTTTTELKEVGTAKLDIPEEAKKKLESAKPTPAPGAPALPKPEDKKEA